MPETSLDEICASRQFSVRSGPSGGDMLTKLSFKAPGSWNKEARSARFVMSAEIPDRYGDIVVAKGIKTDDFDKNPVVLWAHNSRNAPIGMWSDYKAVSGQPRRLEGTANFAAEGLTEEADQVARLVEASLIRACSIGFMPLEWESIDKENPWNGWKFIESDLWECSICSIPANPAALVKAAGGDAGAAMQAIELILDEWTRTPAGTIVPRSAFEKTYNVVRKTDAPTLVEVKSIEEDAVTEITVEVKDADPTIMATVTRLIEEAVAKMVGKKVAPAPVADMTADDLVNINKAADEVVEKDAEEAVATAKAEQERLDAERKAADEQAASDLEDLELRAKALMI